MGFCGRFARLLCSGRGGEGSYAFWKNKDVFDLIGGRRRFFSFLMAGKRCFRGKALVIGRILRSPGGLRHYTGRTRGVRRLTSKIARRITTGVGRIFVAPVSERSFCLLADGLSSYMSSVGSIVFALHVCRTNLN